MKVSEIKNAINEDVRVFRDGEFDAVALLGLRRNETEKHISFVLGSAYVDVAKQEGVECLICPEEIADEVMERFNGGVCVSENPKTTFFNVHKALNKDNEKKPTVIDSSAVIAETAVISPYNVTIGPNVIIEDNVVIRENVTIDEGAVVMDGTVVGTPSFYYFGDADTRTLVSSSGGVTLGKKVVIHSNCSIERGVIGGNTLVDDYSVIDNCILIGHDTLIHKNCIAAASATFAGWVEIGENTFVGLSATFAPMVKVGANCTISMGAVVTKDVPDDSQVSGNFAIDHDKFIDNLKQSVK
ncbi:MAG: hypothetical protein E7226_00815 [Clostridiales bacterium]|nr:hypothetical protein [Clostridiales bacterium]